MNRLQENNEVQSMISYIKDLAYEHDTLFLDIQEKLLLAIQVEYESERVREIDDLLIILFALENKLSVELFITKYSSTYPTICLLFQRVQSSASMISALRDALLVTFTPLSNMFNEFKDVTEKKRIKSYM